MPRIIVLVPDAEDAAKVAEVIAAGAENVRFTEVDVRAVSTPSANRRGPREWTGTDELRDYDGVVFATSTREDSNAALHDALDAAAREQPEGTFLNTVFAIGGTSDVALLARIAALGGIVASPPPEQSRAVGERVATVVAWVRHARSHDHALTHGHSHP